MSIWTKFSGKTELQLAVGEGDLAGVRALIDQGKDVNERGAKGATALSLAVAGGHAPIVTLLLERGADVNVPGRINGRTWLPNASAFCRYDTAGLLQNAAYVTSRDNEGATPLYIASHLGQKDITDTLLNSGADVNARTQAGSTSLIVASKHGHLEIVRALLAHGAEVNAKGNDGFTALSNASQFGHTEIVRLLLQSKADPNADADKIPVPLGTAAACVPLRRAAAHGHIDTVRLLLNAGCSLDAGNGSSTLWVAAYYGHLEVVRLLVDAGASLDPGRDDLATLPCFSSPRKYERAIIEVLRSAIRQKQPWEDEVRTEVKSAQEAADQLPAMVNANLAAEADRGKAATFVGIKGSAIRWPQMCIWCHTRDNLARQKVHGGRASPNPPTLTDPLPESDRILLSCEYPICNRCLNLRTIAESELEGHHKTPGICAAILAILLSALGPILTHSLGPARPYTFIDTAESLFFPGGIFILLGSFAGLSIGRLIVKHGKRERARREQVISKYKHLPDPGGWISLDMHLMNNQGQTFALDYDELGKRQFHENLRWSRRAVDESRFIVYRFRFLTSAEHEAKGSTYAEEFYKLNQDCAVYFKTVCQEVHMLLPPLL
jgi:ankyrin repeat protein